MGIPSKIYPGNLSWISPGNIQENALESPPESDPPEHPTEISPEITLGIPFGISLRVSQDFSPRIWSGISLGTYQRSPAVIFRVLKKLYHQPFLLPNFVK